MSQLGMATLLAIDTSTEACSAALGINGDVRERYEYAPRRHAELILPMVDSLLAEAGLKLIDMDALAFGRGPGAFTGVRIATGVIQGLAFGAGIPVVPVSSLAALAQGAAARHSLIMSAFDARMGEIYWGPFTVGTDGLVQPLSEEKVERPDNVTVPQGDRWFGVGTGWHLHGEALRLKFGRQLAGFEWERYPRAGDILALARRDFAEGNAVTAEEALPVYLRNRVTG